MNNRIHCLCIVLFVSSGLLSAQQIVYGSFPVSQTNPPEGVYPGGRGPDELVHYTPTGKVSSTGTNQYGAEAVYERGRITAVGDNNNPIPAFGGVLSGHGRGAAWVRSLFAGLLVRVNADSVTVSLDDKSLRVLFESDLEEVLRRGARAESMHRWWQQRGKAMSLRWRDGPLLVSMFRRELDSAFTLDFAASMGSPGRELRGVWHRPVERSVFAVDSLLRKLSATGFNAIFLETYWNGRTIYPSAVAEQHETWKGEDPLEWYAIGGKRHEIQVYVWVHTFFVGLGEAPDGPGLPRIVRDHPEWRLVHRSGSTASAAEPGYVWLCPNNPEVRDYVSGVLREIVERYDISGLQLDYIRYPVAEPAEEASCFCAVCRGAAKRDLGIDLEMMGPGDELRWDDWKRSTITAFVRRVRTELPQTTLSAAVFPDTNESRLSKMQDWSRWVREGLLSFVCPMVYTGSPGVVAEMTSSMTQSFPDTPVMVGLAPSIGLGPSTVLREIHAARAARSSGVVLFAMHSVSDDLLKILGDGPFKRPAGFRLK